MILLVLLAQLLGHSQWDSPVVAPMLAPEWVQPGSGSRAPFINVMAAPYFCKGDGVTDDTACIQAAVNYAAATTVPSSCTVFCAANGHRSKVFFPDGYYKITSEVTIPGTVTLEGPTTATFGGAKIRQFTSGAYLFKVTGDGTSASVEFRYLYLRSDAVVGNSGIALIYVPNTITQPASIYIRNMWFQNPEGYSVAIEKADDVQITDCTFDVGSSVGSTRSIMLGTTTSIVTNSLISRNAFYQIKSGILDAINVDGLVFAENRVYGDPNNQTPYVVNALTTSSGYGQSPVAADRLMVIGNNLNYANNLLQTKFSNFVAVNNVARRSTDTLIQLGGGGTVSKFTIANNILSGVFPNATAAIDSTGTTVSTSSTYSNDLIGNDAIAWVGSTGYVVGSIRTNDSGKLYKVVSITTGISASSGGPTGTGAGIVDGGVTWNYVTSPLGINYPAGGNTNNRADGNTFSIFTTQATVAGSQGLSITDSPYSKQIRVAGCATAAAAGAVCTTAVTWTTAFADTNYSVTCGGALVTSGVPVDGGLSAKAAGSVTFRTIAMTAVAAQYTNVDCQANHD